MLLVCGTGDLFVGLPVASVIETMRPLPLQMVGDAPTFVMGLARIRGEPVPVVDLAALLGVERSVEAGQRARWVTVRAERRQVALEVDVVLGAQPIAAGAVGDLPPLLSGAKAELIAGLARRDDGLLVVLETGRLVPAEILERLHAAPRGPDG